MTRVDAHCPSHPVSIKLHANSANFCRFITAISIALTCTVVYHLLSTDSLGNPSDQYVLKTIPKVYTEGIDPEDREVFTGFKTSFLPGEELILTLGGDKDYEEKGTSDTAWEYSKKQQRVKRMSNLELFTSQEYDPNRSEQHTQIPDENEDEESEEWKNESEVDEEYKIEDQESIESVLPPEPHMDRGPLDDVVEQVRGQPELEEGEMVSSAHLYKPARSYTVIHAFWKGQGDRETIRAAQANIMKQYMDPEADPCHDFYQYACGNWAALNPIPADKAGYDTFEMLRENLDAVLKDLLEFKTNDTDLLEYPGSNLEIEDNFLDHIPPPSKEAPEKQKILEININYPIFGIANNHSEILSRIRRYLDRKSKELLKPIVNMKNKMHKYIHKKTQNSKTILKYEPRLKRFVKKPSQSNLVTMKKADIEKNILHRNRQHGRKILNYHEISKRRNKREERITKDISNANPRRRQMREDADPSNGDAAMKARFLFKSCMNYEVLQKRSHQPLQDLLNLLGGWPILDPKWNSSNFNWLELMARLRLYNNDILISEWVGPDIKNSDEFVIQFDQTSLGLPTRDYFLQDGNRMYLSAYKKYLITISLLLGGNKDHVLRSANDLIAFEKKLAKITSAPEDRRNVSELYKRMSLRKLELLVPEVDWRRYLCVVMNRTVYSNETVVLFALTYVRNLVHLVDETAPSTLSNYLLWRFVRHRINNLDDRFQSAKQQFYFILFGREQAPPRWKNCISQVNSNMGMALGSMFVQKYFDETSKNDTLTMTREIQQSFRELLHMTDWIDDDTKNLAGHKVDAMMLRIGYPDFILNKKELDDRYKEVIIHPHKYFENILNILQHLTKMEQSRIGQPVNKTLWNTAPAVVNAYYSRNKNQIMFPAGILQPPFYHRHFPRSLNYGGIGVVIGHEITHGFDDKGRLFDCDGNLHRWWSDTAIESFHQRAQCLIDQYGRYVVPEVNMKLDGVNTQGENIADNGGVKQAFRAYLRWLKKNEADGETLPGLNHTHTQLFFLNFAQVWCGAMRPEAMRNKLKTAVHSPGRFRVIGTLSNSHDFAREFLCPPGSPMNPKEKCSVW